MNYFTLITCLKIRRVKDTDIYLCDLKSMSCMKLEEDKKSSTVYC